MTRDEALALLNEHLHAENLIKHSLATEAIMRALARKLDCDEERWGLAGLLHDLDFEETRDDPSRHGLRTAELLAEKEVDNDIIDAIEAHNAEELGGERTSPFDHALAAAESITGLIVATALVYPDQKLASVKPESILKRMQKKDFARGVSRDTIRECEKLGIDLPSFAALSLEAMQGIAGELGL